jgi:DNA-binding transcriptional LysR family regulator
MMDFQLLRTFHAVLTEGGFSTAAKSLNVTQSSVSQQIARLEVRLEDKLFQRIGRRVLPTPAAHELNRLAIDVLERVREFEEKSQRLRKTAEGPVRYAMPESCQWTPHFQWVMNALSDYPAIQARVQVLPNARVIEELHSGNIDFGFLVGEKPTPDFSYERFSDERYSGVASNEAALKAGIGSKDPREARMIFYPGADLYLDTWSKALGLAKRFRTARKTPALEVSTLAGAIQAVKSGSGFAVVPTHCVRAELETKQLREWLPRGVTPPSQPIYLARRRSERAPHRVEVLLALLKKSKTEVAY